MPFKRQMIYTRKVNLLICVYAFNAVTDKSMSEIPRIQFKIQFKMQFISSAIIR